MAICERCSEEIPAGDEMKLHGKTVCEDCFIAGVQPPKTCDVTAVYSAKKHREMMGHTGTEGLTEIQKNMYEFVKSKGKVTKDELMGEFDLSPMELERQISVMRHCELLKGMKEGKNIFITIMN